MENKPSNETRGRPRKYATRSGRQRAYEERSGYEQSEQRRAYKAEWARQSRLKKKQAS